MSAPPEPICQDETGTAPCRWATTCPEVRQRAQSSWNPPIRANACFAFQHLTAAADASEAQAEREAIAAEGA